ncbi:nagb/rpia/CoA transferase-like protein [Coniochaeta sp. PMI_546]|nr:nagb/rpia/CoA transferase-like protein [Coniochaeta sp. PMI_546]
MAKRIATSQAHKDVHPAVLALGQQMATFTIRDSITRLKYMLLAFRKVIESYETPKGNSLSRHFIPHVLNPQIEYLTECRPMSFSMGNAIRLIKAKVNKFDIDTPEDDAKEAMLDMIDNFVNERITLAELVIARNAADMIADGDVILTYRHHRLVEKALRQALRDGKRFEVQVIDDPLDQTGLVLAKVLRREGVRVYYSPHLGGTHQVGVRRASKVIVGGEAIFANGSLYGPAGTCDLCLAASDAGTPVVALCETINFDRDRVANDSLTYNEIDPERGSGEAFRLLFDTTREKYLGVVVTEYESETGNSPAQSILAILRKQEDQI